MAFGRSLNLDKTAGFVHDDIHVGFGLRVLRIVEVQNRYAAIDPNGYRSDLPMQWVLFRRLLPGHALHRQSERDVSAADRSRTRTTVCLNNIAVQRNGALTQCVKIGNRAQRPPDKPLDFECSAALLAARCFA